MFEQGPSRLRRGDFVVHASKTSLMPAGVEAAEPGLRGV